MCGRTAQSQRAAAVARAMGARQRARSPRGRGAGRAARPRPPRPARGGDARDARGAEEEADEAAGLEAAEGEVQEADEEEADEAAGLEAVEGEVQEAAEEDEDPPFGPGLFTPSYNICPGMFSLVVRADDDGLVLDSLKWGLESPPGGPRLNLSNARSDNLARSPVFRPLAASQRAVVPVEGFFEWLTETKAGASRPTKRPFYVRHAEEGRTMCMAGLWSEGAYTVVTCDSCQALGWLHHRMPVLLDEESVRRWLDPKLPLAAVADLLRPYGGKLRWHEVSSKVSHLRHRGPEVIEPVEVAREKQFAGGIGRFFSRASKAGAGAKKEEARRQKEGEEEQEPAAPPPKAFVTFADAASSSPKRRASSPSKPKRKPALPPPPKGGKRIDAFFGGGAKRARKE